MKTKHMDLLADGLVYLVGLSIGLFIMYYFIKGLYPSS